MIGEVKENDVLEVKSSWKAVRFEFVNDLFWVTIVPLILLIGANVWNNGYPAKHGFSGHSAYWEHTKAVLETDMVDTGRVWSESDKTPIRISHHEMCGYVFSWAAILVTLCWLLFLASGPFETAYLKNWRFRICRKTKTVTSYRHFFIDRRPSSEVVFDRLTRVRIDRPTLLTWANAGKITINGLRIIGPEIHEIEEYLGVFEDPESVAQRIMEALPLHEEFKVDVQIRHKG